MPKSFYLALFLWAAAASATDSRTIDLARERLRRAAGVLSPDIDESLLPKNFLSRVSQMFTDAGFDRPDPECRVHALRLMTDKSVSGDRDEIFGAYEAALDFALNGKGLGGTKLEPGPAHQFALALSGRRGHVDGAARELEAMDGFYKYLSRPLSERGLNLAPQRAREYAQDFAALVPGTFPPRRLFDNDALKKDFRLRYAAHIETLSRHAIRAGGPTLEWDDKFVLMSLVQHDVPSRESEYRIHGYRDALEFGLKSTADSGLGLPLGAAGRYARELVRRRKAAARGEIEAYVILLDALSAPRDLGGFGFDEGVARAWASKISRDLAYPSSARALEYLRVPEPPSASVNQSVPVGSKCAEAMRGESKER